MNERAGTAGRATVLSAVALVPVQERMPAQVGVGEVADATQPLAAVALVGGLLALADLGIRAHQPGEPATENTVAMD